MVSGVTDVAMPGLGRVIQPVLNKVQQGITGYFSLGDLSKYGVGDWLMLGIDVGTDALTGGTSEISKTLSTKWITNVSGSGKSYWINQSAEAAHIAIEPVEIVASKTVEKTTINSVVAGTGSNVVTKGGSLVDDVISTTTRKSTKYGNSVEILLKNGNKLDINATRVKEWIPNLHPNAPIGTFQKVKFENFIPNSKGFKRTPTQSEIDFLNSLFK